MVDEAQERRLRSIAVVQAHGVPYFAELPIVETESKSLRRTTEEVAQRAMALCIVAVKGEGIEQSVVEELVDLYQVTRSLTPKERRFIDDSQPTKHDRIQFAWRYECYWIMLWALGYIDSLDFPG